MKWKKAHINWSRLLYNNKIVMAFSVLLAVVLWAIMMSNDTQDHPRAITGVPVRVQISDSSQGSDLKIFTKIDFTATVYVKGNSMVVPQLKASDFEVVGTLPASITTAGTYNLQLRAQSTGQNFSSNQYTVESIYPQQILVHVDRMRERTFNIQSSISYKKGYESDPSYFVGSPALSSDTVTISGPESQVYQVNRVVYEYTVNDTLRETKKFSEDLVLYDSNGNKIEKGDMTIDPDKIDVTIPVLPRQTVSLKTAFANKPSGISMDANRVQVQPSTIEIAGPKDILSGLNGSISLNPIDFSTISPTHNTFSVNVNLPSTCKNLSNMPTAHVTLNLSDLTTRQITATSFNVANLSTDKNAQVSTTGIPVTVVGPEAEVSKLTGANITGTVDLSGKENFTGQTEAPVTFTISSATSCWVYGSYMANVSVTGKS
jgi:YbbR domain-containing protein